MKYLILGALALLLLTSGCTSDVQGNDNTGTNVVENNIIMISPATQLVNVGDTVTVTADVKEVRNVLGYELDLNYDPAILQVTSTSKGGFLESMGHSTFFVDPDTSTPGLVKNAAEAVLRGGDGISGSGKLVTFTFLAKGTGTSNLELSNVIVVQKDESGQQTEVGLDMEPGSVTVQ
jgi:plastocyanin